MKKSIVCPKCKMELLELRSSGCWVSCGCGIQYVYDGKNLRVAKKDEIKLKDENMTEYGSPFDIKAEKKKINEMAKEIPDAKVKKAFIERSMKELQNHADMLRKMSKFVNSKNKNGMMPRGFND